jgi:hypothetical protein
MSRIRSFSQWAITIALALGFCASAHAQDATTPGAASASTSIHCIGIEWPITGDADHDATCQTEYRVQGAGTWQNALPLLRCDNSDHNGFFGSIFYLDPDTAYEVRLTITDPDGGGTTTTLNATTRAVPAQPTGGNTYHVVPGSGGGDGSSGNPFQGVAAAEAAAQPGDIFLLHAGDYGLVALTTSGTTNNWIVWKGAGDGNAVIRGMTVKSWVWVDGLYFLTETGSPVIVDSHYTGYGIITGLTTDEVASPIASNVCITYCTFRYFDYTIKCRTSCTNWYITDNDIWGANDPITGNRNNDPESGEGIELKKTDGHIVAYNLIKRTADAVSYPRRNCDIYGNEIQDCSDDGVETDNGTVNVRVWGNRITNVGNNVFTFQPMGSGPWYFLRNQAIVTRYWLWKFVENVDDRFAVLHNTFIFPECATKYAYGILNSFSRNNLYIAWDTANPRVLPVLRGAWDSTGSAPGVSSTPFWMTNVDYDGFDWNTKATAFQWAGVNYPTLASFAAGVGIESHGVAVDRTQIFESWATPSTVFDHTPLHMTLKSGANAAVDSGALLYNINEDFTGTAPDLGALERGKPLPHYGPRPLGPTYTLTVNSGSGSGSYSEDQVVSIVADAPQQGYAFDKWTGDTAYVANVNSSGTTLTMPTQAQTVTATYVSVPTYALTVNSGTGDGSYYQSEVVNIVADAPQPGDMFDQWTGDVAYVADVHSSSTTVTMPDSNVTVTATYVTAVYYTLTVNSGTGDGDYTPGAVADITADAPPSGYSFSKWTGDTAYVANVNASSTTVTMPSQSVTVTATYGLTGDTFIESGGLVVIEMEHYSNKAAGAGTYSAEEWLLNTGISGASGDCMQVLPNSAFNAGDTSTEGPVMNYKIDFSTTGVYYLLMRMPAQLSGQDDSCNVGMDGAIFQGQLAGGTGGWLWKKAANTKTVATTGLHTLNAWMREDGFIGDKIVLTTNAAYAPVGTDTGPAESPRPVTVRTYTLTVNSGSGSGDYAEGANVNITADAPGYAQVFDQWTGDVAYVANVHSADTTVTMPAASVTLTATYLTVPVYPLIVNLGSGDGDYPAGAVVSIEGDLPGAGEAFDEWTGDVAYVTDIFSRFTTVTMPAESVVVTATYKSSAGGVTLVESGVATAAILTRPSPGNVVSKAASEFQKHIQLMSGATLPIDTVGNESNYPGYSFVYMGVSTATTAAGIDVSALEYEYYTVRTIGGDLYIVGKDGGADDWTQMSSGWAGTMNGMFHVLGDVLGCRWLWPGDLGRYVPSSSTVIVPDMDETDGPLMEQRKYRIPRIGKCYLTGAADYNGIPIIPADMTRRTELSNEEYLWWRSQRMGTRNTPDTGHYFTSWWSKYSAAHPDYFAELLPGYTQPYPAADRVKLDVSNPAVWQQRIDEWVATGAGDSLNACPNDSRGFCVCADCLAWDRPLQDASIVFKDSGARLSDRYARFWAEIANLMEPINPDALLYGYAYDVYRYAPLEYNVPGNVALAYVPPAPADTMTDLITQTEEEVVGWVDHGCQNMYLRTNWMLSAHVGPFWPLTRVGNHFGGMVSTGGIKGLDSDSSNSSYACMGPYLYIIARLMADSFLTPEQMKDEYCSAFGSAGPKMREYLDYWEDFINAEADIGNQPILGWSSCVAAYDDTYLPSVFDGADAILDQAYAALGPSETEARARVDFMKIGTDHGRLTARAISLVNGNPITSNPQAEAAMRELLAYRDQYADSWAIWREWFIDREGYISSMATYWDYILGTPGYALTVENGEGSGEYHSGAVVPIYADPAPYGMEFDEWTGDVGYVDDVYAPDTMVTMPSSAITVTATYKSSGALYTLDVINGSGDGSYAEGEVVPISADAAPVGQEFDQWTGDVAAVADVNAADTSVTVPAGNVTVTATYKDTRYTLTVNSGSGDGSYSMGTVVPIAADTAPVGKAFKEWTGDIAAVADVNAADTSVTMPAGSVTVTATYEDVLYTLTVNSGSGDGSYAMDSVVPIAADAAPIGKAFKEWTGDIAAVADVNAADTSVTMPAGNVTVRATYEDVLYTLTVNSGSGDGSYAMDSVVPISADTAPVGKAFKEWTGDVAAVADVNAADTSVTMPAGNVTVVATYKDILYALTVNSGSGGGSYAMNSVVAISADAAPVGQVFSQWVGDVTYVDDVFASDANVTMPAGSVTVTATYEDVLYTLTVNSGSGDGSYAMDAVVPISADAAPAGQELDKWTGDAAAVADVNAASTTVTMPAGNVSVAATYRAAADVGTGLLGQYYNDMGLSEFALDRVDSAINFTWPRGTSPAAGVHDETFSVRWTGWVKPQYSQTYTFYTVSDDGIKLWVDGQLVVDDWSNHSAREWQGSIALIGGQKYDIVVEYYDNTLDATAKLYWSCPSVAKQIVPQSCLYPAAGTPPPPPPPPPPPGDGTGLLGEYFNDMLLTDPALARTDVTVDFNWPRGTSPDPSMDGETFSVRWSGQVQAPYSETFAFYTVSDDGVKLWVNGVLLVNNWTNHGATENMGSITLEAGQKYDILMEFYDNTLDATARLLWSSASQPKQIVPRERLYPAAGSPPPPPPPPPGEGTGLHAEYFNDMYLSELAVVRTDATVDFSWPRGTSPDPYIDHESFSVRWSGQVEAPYSGTYAFYTVSDDGVRLWVNDVLLVDNWSNHGSVENQAIITLEAGEKYQIVMEYYDNTLDAVARLLWSGPSLPKQVIPQIRLYPAGGTPPPPPPPPAQGVGLRGEYFNNDNLTDSVLVRTDPTINFTWPRGVSPDPLIGEETFSVRWTGKVETLYDGTYTFYTVSDDGIRLWVNGQLVVNDWSTHSAREKYGVIALEAAQKYDIVIEFFDSTLDAKAQLLWSGPSLAKQIVPQERLYLP